MGTGERNDTRKGTLPAVRRFSVDPGCRPATSRPSSGALLAKVLPGLQRRRATRQACARRRYRERCASSPTGPCSEA